MKMVAILFARSDSIYKTLLGCDVWDMERDARNFAGGMPIVAHPPCRAWGQLSHFANPRPDEKDLARFAVRMIRENGGVLEHPFRSKVWPDQGLPELGRRDSFGGFTVAFPQFWFGHRAQKNTKFYICGCAPSELPEIPFILGEAQMVCASGSIARGRAVSQGAKKGITHREREATPQALAEWLVAVARKTSV